LKESFGSDNNYHIYRKKVTGRPVIVPHRIHAHCTVSHKKCNFILDRNYHVPIVPWCISTFLHQWKQ